jgi:hypothetical protein
VEAALEQVGSLPTLSLEAAAQIQLLQQSQLPAVAVETHLAMAQ